MRLVSFLAIATLTACSSKDAPAPATCPAERVAPSGDCLPAPCGEGEVRIDGTCTAVGHRTCSAGFALDPRGGCATTMPATCADPLVAFPGDTACHPLDECGTERFPASTGPAVYVDGSVSSSGDGTQASPVRTIAEGVSRARAGKIPRVLIAAGTYPERLVVDTAVELRGVCSGKVSITAPDADATKISVAVTADATLAGLSLVGAPSGIAVSTLGGASLTVQGVAIRKYFGGITATRVSTPKVPRVRLDSVSITETEHAMEISIPFEMSKLRVHGSKEGMVVGADGVVTKAVIEDGVNFGLEVESGRVEVSDTVIRRLRGGDAGSLGLWVLQTAAAAEAVVGSSELSDIEGFGLSVNDGRLTVHDTTIRNGSRPPSGNLAGGIAGSKGTLQVTDITVVSVPFAGVLSLGSNTTIERTRIREVLPGDFACGVGLFYGSAGATQSVHGLLVERAALAGVYISGGTSTLRDVRVIDALPDGLGLFGDGVSVVRGRTTEGTLAASLVATGITIEHAARAGISVFGSDLRLSDSRICAAFDLEGNDKIGATATNPVHIEDAGNNVCGCGAPLKACSRQQSDLVPVPSPF